MFKSRLIRLAMLLTMTLGALGTLGSVGFASGPVFWATSKQDEIARGDAKGISIDENGTITLAPTYAPVYDTKEAYIWSSATDSFGNTYLGTGHGGRIFKVDKAGTGSLLYAAGELDVTALTVDPQGNLYAGTSPDGKIYKITPDGKAAVLYDPPDKYIWSLAYDPGRSILYAGTGNKGIIYAIDSAGKGSTLATTSETNIVSLALDKAGNLIAGTDPSGLVLRISPAGKVFALLDSPLQEIHAVQSAPDGSIYALGVNQQAASQRAGNVGVSSTTSISNEGVITISTADEQDAQGGQGAASGGEVAGASQNKLQSRTAEGAKSALIHILADGNSEVMWASREIVAFSMRLLGDGRVLIGTGNKGRIYSVYPNRTSSLLIQSPEDQTSTIIGSGDDLLATSSNLGRLYRIGKQTETEGTYTSPTRDAKFVAGWGNISWRGTGAVQLETRTGNTDSPDSTWSDWSTPYNDPGAQIASPTARFIQWRAILTAPRGSRSAVPRGGSVGVAGADGGWTTPGGAAESPSSLQSVTVAYLPKNQAPDIASVTTLPPGVALQEMPVTIDPSVISSGLDPALFGVALNIPPRRFFQKGARSLTWQASDPNDDTLVYEVFYRSVGDSDWRLLAENLTQPYYTIDGNRLPDGAYVFKV
ncbi:MAG TPA: WD40 repeat domain-containing protein, partial [Blastocatellia bacterium]|nr:WD40 repeat domain-containing protein [Blastocatellia bacterium]